MPPPPHMTLPPANHLFRIAVMSLFTHRRRCFDLTTASTSASPCFRNHRDLLRISAYTCDFRSGCISTSLWRCQQVAPPSGRACWAAPPRSIQHVFPWAYCSPPQLLTQIRDAARHDQTYRALHTHSSPRLRLTYASTGSPLMNLTMLLVALSQAGNDR